MRAWIVASSFAIAASQDLFLESRSAENTGRVGTELLSSDVLEVLHQHVGAGPNVACMVEHCSPVLAECVAATGDTCYETFKCISQCSKADDGHNRIPGCAYLCEMTSGYSSKIFGKMIKCMGQDHKCLPTYPDDGDCLAVDADAVQNITTLDQLEGDWWVVKGVNCGQVADGTRFSPKLPDLQPTTGRNFPGGYDWYPCQHERFVRSSGHDFPNPTTPWVNNITYCGGSNGGKKECNTSIIDTVANVTMCAPGVVCHTYTDAPLKPQYEHWRIISAPHPDWVASIWCGQTPLVTYNGGIALGRNHRSVNDMPKWVEENFRAAYKRFGVEWDQMCPSTNEDCP